MTFQVSVKLRGVPSGYRPLSQKSIRKRKTAPPRPFSLAEAFREVFAAGRANRNRRGKVPGPCPYGQGHSRGNSPRTPKKT